MFTLRCTQKLLRRTPWESSGSDAPPTTVLGDWYANLIICRPQHLVLAVSERTLLPVLVPAKDAKGLPGRVTSAVEDTLATLGVDEAAIRRELQEMQAWRFGKTANRRVLGSMNDLIFQLGYQLAAHPERSLLDHGLALAETPCGPLEYGSPRMATEARFLTAAVLRNARQISSM